VAVGPRRLASDDDGIDVRSGSEIAGLIRDDGPARLADAAPEIVTIAINTNTKNITVIIKKKHSQSHSQSEYY